MSTNSLVALYGITGDLLVTVPRQTGLALPERQVERLEPTGALPESPSGNDIPFLRAPLLSNFTSGLFSWAQAVKATLWRAFFYN